MNTQIQQDEVNSNVFSTTIDGYEVRLRIEFPLKGGIITTVEDSLAGRIPGTYGLLTPHHEADGKTLFAVTTLRRNDSIVASATVFILKPDSWRNFAQYIKRSNLADKFIEIAHELVELWLVKEWDNTWGSLFTSLLTRMSEVTRLDDAIDRLNGIIATLVETRRLVPVVAEARGDSDELGEKSMRLLTAHRFVNSVVSKQIGSVSEVKQIAKRLGDVLGIKR